MPLSFLFVVDEFHPVQHAPAVRIGSFADALSDHAVTVLGGCNAPPPAHAFRFRVVSVQRAGERQPVRFLGFLLRLASAARRLTRRERFDCIVVSVPKFELLLIALALRGRAPRLVVDFRDSLAFGDYDVYLRHFLPGLVAVPMAAAIKAVLGRLLRAACHRADLLTAANEAIARSLPVNGENVLTVPNGVDTDVFRPRARVGLPPLNVAYVGNFAEKDRFELIAAALSESALRVDLHLVGTGRNKPAIVRLLRDAGVMVIDHGAVPHERVPEVLGRAHIGLLFRSHRAIDSIPVSLYEFCALNIPVVVNDVGIMAAFVRRHGLGWIVDDHPALHAVLTAAACDPAVVAGFTHLHEVAAREFPRKCRAREMRDALLALTAGTHAPRVGSAL